jgi:hypothetical protein
MIAFAHVSDLSFLRSDINGICVVGGNSHSSPWFALSDTTYSNMVNVPTDTQHIYIYIYIYTHTHITTYLPNDARVINIARTALHMLRKRIHIWQKASTRHS